MEIGSVFQPINWFRFVKKGVFFGITVGVIGYIMDWITKLFGFPIMHNVTDIKMYSGLGIVFAIVSIAITFILAGFVVEYANEGKNGLIKWINK